MSDPSPSARMTPAKITKLINAALAGAEPGAEVSVEVDGVRVTVRKMAEPVRASSSAAEEALARWERGRP